MNNINKLKEKIDVLISDAQVLKAVAEKMMEVDKPKNKKFSPKYGEIYFFIDAIGDIIPMTSENDRCDIYRTKTRNCFRTEKDAEDYKSFIDIESRLMDLADELEETSPYQHYIFYNVEENKILGGFCSKKLFDCEIYCCNNNFCDIALERIGFEDLKFYLTYKR